MSNPALHQGPTITLLDRREFSWIKRMVDDMDESFLITPSWDKVSKRIKTFQEEGGPSTMLRINSRDGG